MKFLGRVWKSWLKVARIVGNFQSQVILSLFYIIILLPLGLFFRFFANPLNLGKLKARTSFQKWEHEGENLDQAKKQY